MRLIFSDEAWEDYLFWQKQDRCLVDRINKPINSNGVFFIVPWHNSPFDKIKQVIGHGTGQFSTRFLV